MQEVWVQSLVGELRSHMSCGQNIKQKQYYNKFNKDFFKKGHIKKILKEEKILSSPFYVPSLDAA